MGIFDYFRSKKSTASASTAKERLQIIVAHERNQRRQPDFLPKMQQEILQVIKKYVDIDMDQITVELDESDNCSILELNITLAD